MRLRPIAAIVLRQLYLMRSSPVRVLPMIAWVAVDIVLWGFIARYLNSVTATGMNFVASLLGAVLFWDFFTRVMQGVTMAFFEDVWSRNFINVFASPMLISEYLSGLVLAVIHVQVAEFFIVPCRRIVPNRSFQFANALAAREHFERLPQQSNVGNRLDR